MIQFPVSPSILRSIADLDAFRGAWSVRSDLQPDRLARFQEAARVQSVAASCRMAGMRVSDGEVAALLRGEAAPLRDADEIRGYSAAKEFPLPADRLIQGTDLARLNAVILGAAMDSGSVTPWRRAPQHREEFDAAGQATGRVFPTLPARMVEDKTEELLTWLEFELRSRENHPAQVIAGFVLCLLAISPFERGSGRLARLLSASLMHRAGYAFMPYASLELQMEESRSTYFEALDRGQTGLWSGDAKLDAWMDFFLGALERHRGRVEAKIALELSVHDYPPLQRTILETVREHGNVDAALLLKATGANRNTLKDNLRRLVQRGVLQKTGERRSTRYALSSGDPTGRDR